MPDRLSALASVYRPGTEGSEGAAPATVTLSERRGVSMLLLACFPPDRGFLNSLLQERLDLGLPDPGRAHVKGNVGLLWQGPNRWLLEAPDTEHDGLVTRFEEALADHPAVSLTDLSHARSVIRLSGPDTRHLLAKDCSLDLDADAFRMGDCALTRFGHYAVTLHATTAHEIDLYVTRSFALSLWEELLDLGAEYGVRVTDPGAER